MDRKMKILHGFLSIAAAFFLIVVLTVTAAEMAVYSDFGFYESQYKKYEVLNELNMEMSDAMDVTNHMMFYLRGQKEDLVIKTNVDGQVREFFNDREKTHMEDVRGLFLKAIKIRNGSLLCFLVSLFFIFLLKGNIKKLVSSMYIYEAVAFLSGIGIFAFLISHNFSKYFVRFHELFFDNDLWRLDPETDLLIRMLPEGFFFDFAFRIGLFIIVTLLFTFILSVIIYNRSNQIVKK